jgi:hypothetical protein
MNKKIIDPEAPEVTSSMFYSKDYGDEIPVVKKTENIPVTIKDLKEAKQYMTALSTSLLNVFGKGFTMAKVRPITANDNIRFNIFFPGEDTKKSPEFIIVYSKIHDSAVIVKQRCRFSNTTSSKITEYHHRKTILMVQNHGEEMAKLVKAEITDLKDTK